MCISNKPPVIAIDGPAASGKSTIGYALAQHLGYLYFDTGVLYRAVTWVALERDLDIMDDAAITALTESLHVDVLPPTVDDGRQYTILADGQDITWQIRHPQVDRAVSPVSAYPGVRAVLARQQRRIGQNGNVVMVGRDIGTVVLPKADIKLYLDATSQERAKRRYQERLDRHEMADYNNILKALQRRDQIDSGRQVAPLKVADDAIVIDTTNLTIERVLAVVIQQINQRS